MDRLAAHGVPIEALAAERARPALRACVAELAERAQSLLRAGAPLPYLIANARLGFEIAAIHGLALTLAGGLTRRDPLSEPVHLGKAGFALTTAVAVARHAIRRTLRRPGAPRPAGNPV